MVTKRENILLVEKGSGGLMSDIGLDPILVE
jgi:hypothetical protein